MCSKKSIISGKTIYLKLKVNEYIQLTWNKQMSTSMATLNPYHLFHNLSSKSLFVRTINK